MNVKASVVRTLNRHVLPRWRLVLRKSDKGGDDLPLPGPFRDRLIDRTAALLDPYLREAHLGLVARPLIEEFLGVYARRPVRDNAGGTAFNGSLVLFALARALNPVLIVECGTWKGHTAWLFRQAAPAARIVTCDIEHENLEHREPGIEYRLGDWTGFGDLNAESPQSLVFFDDHVSHARRLREAHQRGFRTVILDDDVPAEAMFVTGDPPAPTAAMLSDPAIAPGTEIAWTYRGRKFHHVVTAEALSARALLAERLPAPDLAPATWQSRHNGISLVRLRG
ncbi:hypothetical protein [Desertibaculum subflavum]|uniref:hypothetical protein n=1 Tax=Desertibaculum subflavum TaxID=2268458 RepID=UPI000E668429